MSEWEDIRRQARAVIGEEEPLRLDLPERDGAPVGRLFVDHAAPALAVHRCPPASPEHPARCSEAHRLVTSQPAYLLASAAEPDQAEIRTLATATAESLADRTGAALLIEVWTPFEHDDEDVDPFGRRPGFTLYVPDAPAVQAAGAALADALSGIEIAEQGADVTCITTDAIAPPGLAPLVDGTDGRIALLGLAVDAVFLNPREGEFYPRVLDALRSALAPALATATQTFAREAGTPAAPAGRRHLEPVAEVVDSGLSELSREYGFLLQVTPVNAAEAWDAFQTGGYETAPELLYRPLTFDPDALRRQLFALPVERVEDPDVAALLREKRDEIGAEVQMILDRETPGFLAGSLKVYGAPDDRLVALAHGVLDALPESDGPADEIVGATAFASLARAELDHYRAEYEGFTSSVEIRDDIPGSLMVSKGHLLVGAAAGVPAPRVRALLAHEVGTHVLTYYNGCAQPLRVLRHGLAGYEDLQEGLAVLAEWLVGGLTASRMRTLAARVLAARCLVEGATFVEAFRQLREATDLSARAAFGIVLRVFRGGGLTKDMVYLRGLRDLLRHLADGGAYWPLFVGKIALRHLPLAESLRQRGVLGPVPLRPRYADDPDALARLDRVRGGLSVLDLLR